MQRVTDRKITTKAEQPPPAGPGATAPALAAHPRAVLVIILVSYLMIVLDISIVITTLPKMHIGRLQPPRRRHRLPPNDRGQLHRRRPDPQVDPPVRQRLPARRRARAYRVGDVPAQPADRRHPVPDRRRPTDDPHRRRPGRLARPADRRRRRRRRTRDAGAASGLVNVAHQLGGSLGLGILVAVFAAAGATALDAEHLFADRVALALTVGTGMLALALVLVLALIVAPHRHNPKQAHRRALRVPATSSWASHSDSGEGTP